MASTQNGPLATTPADIHCRHVTKFFDDTPAVEGVSLEVPAGQIMTLLGPILPADVREVYA